MSGDRRGHWFDCVATRTAEAIGSPTAMATFVVLVVVWLALGPLSGFSDPWQLVANTATTIVTTGLVILLQYTTNKGDRAIQLKLDVLIDASQASNRYASIEDLDAKDLIVLRDRVQERIAAADPDGDGQVTS